MSPTTPWTRSTTSLSTLVTSGWAATTTRSRRTATCLRRGSSATLPTRSSTTTLDTSIGSQNLVRSSEPGSSRSRLSLEKLSISTSQRQIAEAKVTLATRLLTMRATCLLWEWQPLVRARMQLHHQILRPKTVILPQSTRIMQSPVESLAPTPRSKT